MIFNEYSTINSFSLYVSNDRNDRDKPLLMEDYMRIGKSVCSTLSFYLIKKYTKLSIHQDIRDNINNVWTNISFEDVMDNYMNVDNEGEEEGGSNDSEEMSFSATHNLLDMIRSYGRHIKKYKNSTIDDIMKYAQSIIKRDTHSVHHKHDIVNNIVFNIDNNTKASKQVNSQANNIKERDTRSSKDIVQNRNKEKRNSSIKSSNMINNIHDSSKNIKYVNIEIDKDKRIINSNLNGGGRSNRPQSSLYNTNAYRDNSTDVNVVSNNKKNPSPYNFYEPEYKSNTSIKHIHTALNINAGNKVKQYKISSKNIVPNKRNKDVSIDGSGKANGRYMRREQKINTISYNTLYMDINPPKPLSTTPRNPVQKLPLPRSVSKNNIRKGSITRQNPTHTKDKNMPSSNNRVEMDGNNIHKLHNILLLMNNNL